MAGMSECAVPPANYPSNSTITILMPRYVLLFKRFFYGEVEIEKSTLGAADKLYVTKAFYWLTSSR